MFQELLQFMSHLTGVLRNPKVDYRTQESQEYIPEHWLCLEQLIIRTGKTKYGVAEYSLPQLTDREGNDRNYIAPATTWTLWQS